MIHIFTSQLQETLQRTYSYLENSTLPFVHRATKFVNPMPNCLSLKSSLAFIGSGMRRERYKHFPVEVQRHVISRQYIKHTKKKLLRDLQK